MIDLGLWICYLLFIGALVGMAGFSVLNMLRDTKNAKNTLIGIGVLVGIFLLCFLVSSNTVLPKYEQFGITPSKSKMIGAGLILGYLMGIGTIVIGVYAEIRKIFMK